VIRRPAPLLGRIESFTLDSRALQGNRLGDPHRRDVHVYLPPEALRFPRRRFPVFVDLVGFLGSGRSHLNWKAFDESVPLRLERLVRRGKMGPVIAVFPDCWTRLGGNQYIDSSAVGNYAGYLLHEVLPEVDRRYPTHADPRRRAVFGKSSGGYGAIVHGMRYARHWGALACHSGDMYFEFCYGTDIPRTLATLARYGSDPARFLREFYRKPKMDDAEAHAIMFLAMAAFYDPDPRAPLGFRLPMDLHTGEIDASRWRRWQRHDPVRLLRQPRVQRALRSLRGIYLDCGSRDQYHLHYGARQLHQRLRALGIPHRYEEFDDNHSQIDYRMDVSLPWLYRRVSMGLQG
jgi:S-formylglutathione hydrolase FrmB